MAVLAKLWQINSQSIGGLIMKWQLINREAKNCQAISF